MTSGQQRLAEQEKKKAAKRLLEQIKDTGRGQQFYYRALTK